MNERVVLFAGELLTALAQRADLTKVMVDVNQAEGVVTAFASKDPCGRSAMYTVDFSDLFLLSDANPLITRMISRVESQLAGKILVDDWPCVDQS